MTTRIAMWGQWLIVLLLIMACSDEQITPNTTPPIGDNSSAQQYGVSLRINVPTNEQAQTYAEAATTTENRIDTLFVSLYSNGSFVKTFTFDNPTTEPGTRDSVIVLQFESDQPLSAPVRAEVFANRKEVKPITGEIVLPTSPQTAFLMSGEATLATSTTGYQGTVHLARNVAKFRINVLTSY